jgi:tRNA (cmo5U34)-methyltransferase
MSHSVQSHLRVSPNEYDIQIRRFIPGYEEMLDTVCRYLRYLATRGEKEMLITELGSGTGGLIPQVARALPDASIVAIDCDADMVEVARNRLGSFSKQVRYITETFDRGLSSGCDAVIASLALHHILVRSTKTALYKQIFSTLAHNGVFINADAAVDQDGSLSGFAYDAWIDHMVANGIDRNRAVDHLHAWQMEDRYFSLTEELEMLKEAGFKQVDILWRRGPIAVIAAMKSP